MTSPVSTAPRGRLTAAAGAAAAPPLSEADTSTDQRAAEAAWWAMDALCEFEVEGGCGRPAAWVEVSSCPCRPLRCDHHKRLHEAGKARAIAGGCKRFWCPTCNTTGPIESVTWREL